MRSPLCCLGERDQLEGGGPLPLLLKFPGLGHVERHANEAVGDRAAVANHACTVEHPADAAARLEHAVFHLELPVSSLALQGLR